MWRDLPCDGIADRNHRLSGGNFHLDAVDPAPDMHLADFRARRALSDTARQRRLTTCEAYGDE